MQLRGNRTYLSIAAMVIVAVAPLIPESAILSPQVTAAVVALLGALAAYFRSQA